MKKNISVFVFMFLWFSFANLSYVKGPDQPTLFLNARQDVIARSMANICNWGYWIRYDGESANTPDNNSGGFYPRGTAATIYQDGLIYGGYIRDIVPPISSLAPKIRVGGLTYRIGTNPGWIVVPGDGNNHAQPIDQNNSRLHLYRVRWDYAALLPQDPSNVSNWDPSIIRDAQEQFQLPTMWDVTAGMCQEIWDNYDYSWINWPVDLGAPFYDVNQNGIYDSGVEIDLNGDGQITIGEREEPGIAKADQVLWFVTNDADSFSAELLYGSPPIGFEIQTTMWCYNQPSVTLGQSVFKKFMIINKSGYRIDSMFVALWSDPDIGAYTNDFVGCDPSLSVGFAYNGEPTDVDYQNYGLAPPAMGYDFLQGPIVPSPGDTAIFNLKKRPGYKNLLLTSFGYFAAGSPISDPDLGEYNGTIQWYNLLNGYIPVEDSLNQQPYIHGSGPNAGLPTKFPLDGEPFTGTGDLDGFGTNLPPGDRRVALNSGPFTFMPGDTQEVVVGIVGGISDTYLASVNEMKANDIVTQQIYNSLFEFTPIDVETEVDFVLNNQTDVHFAAFSDKADSIRIYIKQYQSGNEVAQLSLYDDGLHGDGIAGDGEFGSDWQTTPFGSGLYADARVQYQSGGSFYWGKVVEGLTTSGPVIASEMIVGSDNLNHDGNVNPGENIRYVLDVYNGSAFTYSNVTILQTIPMESQYVSNLWAPNYNHVISFMNSNSHYTWPYSANSNYYQFDISELHPGNDSIHIAFQFTDENNNTWSDTAALWVELLPTSPQDHLMTHITGNSYGELGYRIFDPNLLAGHSYRVSFNDSLPNGDPLYELRDLTVGNVLLIGQPYPDILGHNSQVVDGFFITRGTTIPKDSLGWEWISSGARWLTGVNWGGRIFFGGIDIGSNFFGSTIPAEDVYTVKIIFDSSLVTNCAVYRRDLGYAYNGIGTFYGEAYDWSDPSNPRRLNIVFVEDNNQKPADMIWNPDANNGAREYFYIMDSDYDAVTAGGYNDDYDGTSADVLWGAWTSLRGTYTFLESPAEFYLILQNAIAYGNVYEFTPQWTGLSENDMLPKTFELFQNYPNPFNPTTTIRFNLPQNVKVKLDIFNVLGQKIVTLLDNNMEVGRHAIVWDGKNSSGVQVGTGLYFYRIQAGDFVKTRKMVLLR